jgi:hypothetical protein
MVSFVALGICGLLALIVEERLGIERDPRRRPLRAGQVIRNTRLRVQILELRGGAPTRVRFDFTAPLSNVRIYTRATLCSRLAP